MNSELHINKDGGIGLPTQKRPVLYKTRNIMANQCVVLFTGICTGTVVWVDPRGSGPRYIGEPVTTEWCPCTDESVWERLPEDSVVTLIQKY